jgi:hypothetical protein
MTHRTEWNQPPTWGQSSTALNLLPPSTASTRAIRPCQMSQADIVDLAERAEQCFQQRSDTGQCRPSETKEMHQWPFVPLPAAEGHQASANGSLSADFLEALLSPDNSICRPPVTGPTRRDLLGVLQYAKMRTAKLLARREEIESRARATPPPAHPKDLFVRHQRRRSAVENRQPMTAASSSGLPAVT